MFRIFRLLRVIKLAKSWHSLNYFLSTIGNAIQKMGSFTLVLYLFMFTYTILGMEMYAQTLRFNRKNEAIDYFSEPRDDTSLKFSHPDANFDNFWSATVSIFIVFANDYWSTIYFDHYRVNGGVSSSIFFIGLVILGQMVLFNLFLAILLKEFDERSLI